MHMDPFDGKGAPAGLEACVAFAVRRPLAELHCRSRPARCSFQEDRLGGIGFEDHRGNPIHCCVQLE